MAFNFTVTITDPSGLADDALIAANVRAAFTQWGKYVAGKGSIDIEVKIGTTSQGRANGGPTTSVYLETEGARTIYTQGTNSELASGIDPNGSAPDGVITIDPAYLPELWLSPIPGAGAAATPGLTDGLSVFLHEAAHILGMVGWWDLATHTLPATYESVWDRLLTTGPGGSTVFSGANANLLFGGPVPITSLATSQAYYHIGNSDKEPIVGQDLMNGIFFYRDHQYAISPLDVAMIKDAGAPLSAYGDLYLKYCDILRFKSVGSVTSSATAWLAQAAAEIDAGAHDMAYETAGIIAQARATSSVATLAYTFFTGNVPSLAGMDYLVSPDGPNPNNLNAPYYQAFSVENRYINFAVNLGAAGEGAARFSALYAALPMFEATRKAYATIFGSAPSDTKLHALLDPTFQLDGRTFTRAEYFAYYGRDGAEGIGAKAAMVGWLLSEAVKADVGTYALANDGFFSDVALHNAPFGVDLIGVYAKPEYIFHST